MNSSAALLATESVTASRPAEVGRLKPIVKATTLAVNAGECVTIVGPPGRCKSPFPKLLNRLSKPGSGIVFLAGRFCPRQNRSARSSARAPLCA